MTNALYRFAKLLSNESWNFMTIYYKRKIDPLQGKQWQLFINNGRGGLPDAALIQKLLFSYFS